MSINSQLNLQPNDNIGSAETASEPHDNVVKADFGSKPAQITLPENNESLSNTLANAWLEWQCKMVSGIIKGVVFEPNAIRSNSEIAIWPKGESSEVILIAAATQALKKNGGVKFSKISYGPQKNHICDVIACPLYKDGDIISIVSVSITIRSEPQQHAVLQLLSWGGIWIESLVQSERQISKRVSDFPLKLISSVLHQTSFQSAIIETVNLLASFFECDRVTIGIRQGMQVRLTAISNIKTFDARMQVVRATEAAMEESIDQLCVIAQPDAKPASNEICRRAHFELSRHHGNNASCTLPLFGDAGVFGAITFERPQNQPFDETTISLMHSLLKNIAPILDFKKRDVTFLSAKSITSKAASANRLLSNSNRRSLLLVLAIVSALLAAYITDGEYEVSAPSSLESDVVRLLVAPQDGYIKQTHARAGDVVEEGQVITSLEDKSLNLKLQRKLGESHQLEQKYQEALVQGERTKIGILEAQLEQTEADIHLIENEISQTQLISPFDGVVVSGDLSQSLGSPVKAGQVLFKVAPLDEYRVVIEVDEHEIEGLDIGSTGHLIVAALPQTKFPITVNQIAPLAVIAQANNYFQIEAFLDEHSSLLRPGMHGVAKIQLGQRNLLWIWTHTLIERIRLWAWSVGL